ncbi:hypothetical protein FRB94_007626 [Tulasnella sp. JGI-2019a]|nr:hypothetical protein FRB94_007626 [Tulasnella sp. JGI-2019a]
MAPEIDYLDDQMEEGDSSPPPSNHADSPVANASGQSKKSVQRGARACQVCRAAKMRCLGGDDQASDTNPCNRCKKSNVQCVFEKHRRGRKPGSKISEAGKARRMERVNEVRMQASSARLSSPIEGHTNGAGGSEEPSNSMPSLTSAAITAQYRQQQPSMVPFPKLEESGSVNPLKRRASEEEEHEHDHDMDGDDGNGRGSSMQRQKQQQHQRGGPGTGSGTSIGDRRMQTQSSSYSSTAHPSPTVMPAFPGPHNPHNPHGNVHSHSSGNNTIASPSSGGGGNHNHNQNQNQNQNSFLGSYAAPPPLESSVQPPMQHHPHSYDGTRPITPRDREGARTVIPQQQSHHNHRPSVSISGMHLPPIRLPPTTPRSAEDTDDLRADDNLYPQNMLARERTRQSFLATVLGPTTAGGASPSMRRRESMVASTPRPLTSNGMRGNGDGGVGSSSVPNTARSDGNGNGELMGRMGSETEIPLPPEFVTSRVALKDPIDLGIVTFAEAESLFQKFFEHLNPCVNLFSPILHTVAYVRSKSKFLFTVMMMACCKYFKPEVSRTLQQMCQVFTSRCMDEQHKSIEVVQAFSCLTYWKELEDNRTWIFVGYACRVALELGLDKFTEKPPPGETTAQLRERRNRERTFLVLFVHDRSLSMQTGRPWMIPEGRLIEESVTWHHNSELSCEDAVVASFVQLRRMSAEVTDVFFMQKRGNKSYDIDFRILLGGANRRLNEWEDYWEPQMAKVGGTEFHVNFLRLFKLHVRLFLNSLGLDNSPKAYQPGPKNELNDTALALCYTSAQDSLEVVTRFKNMGSLRYGQDVLAVMAAYAALFLLRLLRRAGDSYNDYLKPEDVYDSIEKTADAFKESNVKGVPRFIHNLAKGFREMDGQQNRRSESVTNGLADGGAGGHTSNPAPGAAPRKNAGPSEVSPRGNGAPPAGPSSSSRHAPSGSIGGGGNVSGGSRPERPTVATNVTRPPVPTPLASANETMYGHAPQTSHGQIQMQSYQQQQPSSQQPQRQNHLNGTIGTPPTHQGHASQYGPYTNGNSNNMNGVMHSPMYPQQQQSNVHQLHGPPTLQLHQPQPHHIHPPMVVAYATPDAQQHQQQQQQYYQQQQQQYQNQNHGGDTQYLSNLGSAPGTIYESQYDNFMWDQLGLPDAHLHPNPAMAVNQLHIPNNPDDLEPQLYTL